MNLDNPSQRTFGIAITTLLLLAGLGAMAGTVAAGPGAVSGPGGIIQPYFADDAPVGDGAVLMDLVIPFIPQPVPVPSGTEFTEVAITVPTESQDDTLDSLADAVLAFRLCPVAISTGLPSDEACVPLTRTDGDPSQPGVPDRTEYAVTAADDTITIHLNERITGHTSAHVALRLLAPTTTTAVPLFDVSVAGDWGSTNPLSFETSAQLNLPLAVSPGLSIFFVQEDLPVDTAEVPQVTTTDSETPLFYFARAHNATGAPMARVFATWEVDAHGDDPCGLFEVDVNGTAHFDGTRVNAWPAPDRTLPELDAHCHAHAEWGSIEHEDNEPIYVLAGRPDRGVVIVNETFEEVNDIFVFLGDSVELRLNMRDGDANTIGHSAAMWEVVGDCGSVLPPVGPITTLTVNATTAGCHVVARIVDEDGLGDATGTITSGPDVAVAPEWIANPSTTPADTPVTFEARPVDKNGYEATGTISYAVADGTGSIDQSTGVFTPASVGSVTINATLATSGGPVNISTIIEVTPGALTQVLFLDTHATTDADTAVDFNATGADFAGNHRDDPVTYRIVSGSGTINETTGRFVPELTGTTIIEASAHDSATGTTAVDTFEIIIDHGQTTEVRFVAPPATTDADTQADLSAVPVDQNGNPTGATVVYSDDAPEGSIDNTGTFTPVKVGSFTITADADGVQNTTGLTVTPGALAELRFTAAPAATSADDPAAFAVVAEDQHDNVRSDAIFWSTTNGTIDENGLFTPYAADMVTITASNGTVSNTTVIDVSPGDAVRVVFDQAHASTSADQLVTFAAHAEDQFDNPTADVVTWDSSNGTIDADGVFDPWATGEVTITATAAGLTETTTVTVIAGSVATVTITDAPAATDADTPAQFAAEVRDGDGNLRSDTITWDATNGTIDANGLFTPYSAEPVTITASVGAVSDTAEIVVSAGEATSIVFDAAPASVAADSTAQFAAHAEDQFGNPTADVVEWTASNGTIDHSGLYNPWEAGEMTITAKVGALTASTTVEVGPGTVSSVTITSGAATTDADSPVQFAAEVRDGEGNLRGDTITWAASNGAIDADGWFTPQAADTVTITASVGEVSDTAEIVVSAGEATSIVFDLAPASVAADSTVQFAAHAEDQFGNPTDDSIAWDSEPGTIDPDGTYHPSTAGDATVTAMLGAISASTMIEVTAGEAQSLVITEAPTATNADTPVQFVAEVRDGEGNLRSDTIVWSVGESGAIDGDGWFTPDAAETVTITATLGGLSDTAEIVVSAGAAASIVFDLAPSTITADDFAFFDAHAEDANGNPTEDTVSWSRISGTGTVHPSQGIFAPHKTGLVTIRATAGPVFDDHVIEVTPGEAVEVVFTTAPSTTDADTPVTFGAEARDAKANPTEDPVTFTPSDGNIDENGLFTPHAAGDVTITAEAAGFTDTATITVTAGDAATVVITGGAATTTADDPVTFAAEVQDAHGNVVGGSVDWTASAGSIDATGLFTPHEAVVVTITATSGDASDSVTIEVTPGAIADIVFDSAPTSTSADQPVTFEAHAVDQHGNARSDVLTWAASNGTIDDSGVFSPWATGDVTITATSGAESADAIISVSPGSTQEILFDHAPTTTTADDLVSFEAHAVDGFGNPNGATLTWTKVSGSGSISSTHGVFAPSKAGLVTIRAADGAVTADHVIEVTAGEAVEVVFTTAPTTTDADTPVSFEATARDSNGNPTDDVVSYEASNGTIDAAGLFTPYAAGEVTITAQVGTLDALSEIAVMGGAPASVVITSAPATTDADTPVSFEAEVRDTNGNLLSAVPDWSANHGTIAADGTYTPHEATTVTITASSGAHSDSASIVVDPGQLAGVVFDQAPTTTTADDPVTFAAHAVDQHGNARGDAIEWAASDGTIDDGLFTPAGTGTVTITASAGSFSETATIDVTAGALDDLALACAGDCDGVGDAFAVTVTALDQHDNVATGFDGTLVLAISGLLDGPSSGTATCGETAGEIELTFTNGVAGLTCTAYGAGAQTLQVENVANTITTTLALSLDAADVASLSLGCESPVGAGESSACSTTPVDAYGNPQTATVSWTATGGTFTSTTGTSTTYQAPGTIGTYTVTADAGAATAAVDIEVVAGSLETIVFGTAVGQTTNVSADDQSHVVTITGLDAFGNPVASGTTIHWSIIEGADTGSLSAPSTTTDADGVATVVLSTSDARGTTYRVQAVDDPSDPTVLRQSGTYKVVPGELASIDFACVDAESDCATAGDEFSVTMTMYDAQSNVMDDGPRAFSGLHGVTFAGPGVSPYSNAPVCRDADLQDVAMGVEAMLSFTDGVASTTCVLYNATTVSLSVTSGTVTGTIADIAVAPDVADHLVFAGSPAELVYAGDCTAYDLELRDQFGNLQPADLVTVDLESTASGTFHAAADCSGGPVATVDLVDGSAQATVYLADTVDEDESLTLSTTGVTPAMLDVAVHPSAKDHFVLTCADDCATTAGVAEGVTITAYDEHGNVLARGINLYDEASLTFGGAAASPDGDVPGCAAAALGDAVTVDFTAGVATVSCSLYTAETASLTVTDGAIAETTALDVAVQPAPFSRVDSSADAVATAGVAFTVDLAAKDAFGNVLASGDNVFEGVRNVTVSGANLAHTGDEPTSTDTMGAPIAFETASNLSFAAGLASTEVTLYMNESLAGLTFTNATWSSVAAVENVVPGAFAGLAVFLGCDPGERDRACLIGSLSSANAWTATEGDFVSLKAGRVDAYDNVLTKPDVYVMAGWQTAGLTSEISAGSAAGVDWVVGNSGDVGTLTVSKSGVPDLVIDVTVS